MKIREKVIATRSWLERNKIFFETITAVFLATMAVMVSYAQFKMMDKQNQISEANALPQIISTISFTKDNSSNYTDEWLLIDNEGGVIKETDTSQAVFLKATYSSLNPIKLKVLYIPLSGYYGTAFSSGRGKGTITSAFGKNNYAKFHSFAQTFKPPLSENEEMLYVELVRMVRIKYIDIFGKEHIDYQVVDPIGGANALSKSEGERIFSAFNNALKKGTFLDFNKINANNFHDNIKFNQFDSWSIELKSK